MAQAVIDSMAWWNLDVYCEYSLRKGANRDSTFPRHSLSCLHTQEDNVVSTNYSLHTHIHMHALTHLPHVHAHIHMHAWRQAGRQAGGHADR